MRESERIMMTAEERKKARYESRKKWRRANPDKIREQRKRYYQKHKKERNKYVAEWVKKNPEKAEAIRLRYYEKVMRRCERLKLLGVDATEQDYKLI